MLSPLRKREAVDHVVETLGATERRAVSREIAMRFLIRFTVISQHRSTQRKPHVPRQDEDVLTAAIIALAERFGRYNNARPHSSLGYRPPAPQTNLPAALIPPYSGEVAA